MHFNLEFSSRRNPSDSMIQAVVDEWDNPEDVPLDSITDLQQADNINREKASRIVGAAVSYGLIDQPKKPESND